MSSMPTVMNRSRRRAIGIEDSQGGIARARQIAGRVQNPAEDRLQIELGDEASPNLDQAAKSRLIQWLIRHRDPSSLIPVGALRH